MNVNDNVIPLSVGQGAASACSGSGMIGASSSNCLTYTGWTGQPYTYYWYYPYTVPPAPKPSAAEIIKLYKKEFGKDWKRMFAQTVRIEAQ